jgi:hypothetical protein
MTEQYVRVEVAIFARNMEAVLQRHDPIKGDTWRYCDPVFLEKKLVEEFHEWETDRNPYELVDLANLCMMVWSRHHKEKNIP